VVAEAPLLPSHRVYVLKGVDQATLVDVSSIDNTQGFGDTAQFEYDTALYALLLRVWITTPSDKCCFTGLEDFAYAEATVGTSYLHLFTGWANDPKSGSFDVPQVTGTAGAGSNSGSSWAFAFRTIVPRVVFANEPDKGSAYSCTIDVNFDTRCGHLALQRDLRGNDGAAARPNLFDQ